MKKSKIVFCVLFALCILPLNVVFGAWVETDSEGFWGNAYDYYWETPDNATWHTASLDFSYGWIINFTEWKAITQQECHGWGWCVWDDDFEIDTRFWLRDNGTSHTVELKYHSRNDKFYGWESWESQFYIYVDGDLKGGHSVGANRRYQFDVYQNPSNDSECIIKVRWYDLDWILHGGFDGTYNFGASWFNNVTLEQTHDAWGKGWVLGTKTEEEIRSNEDAEGLDVEIPSVSESFWVQLWDQIRTVGSVLPEPLKSWIANLNDWLDTFWGILTMVWGMVVAFLPVLGIFYFMSFLGVFFTGIVTGNVDLLQTYIMKQYELANGFVNTLVSTIHAIWSLIKIW